MQQPPGAAESSVESPAEARDQPIAVLVRQLAEQTALLARQEVRLAQAEVAGKSKTAGLGVGVLGAAGIAGGIGSAALLSAGGAALALVLPPWGAILCVAGLVLLVAGVLGLLGGRDLQRVAPAVPERSVESLRADVAAVQESIRHG